MTKINVKLDNKAKNVISKTAGISAGGGGLAAVDKLPEKGNVGALYKLPNGEIWSWYHEERQEEVEVPDFSVGGTYQLQNSVPADALYGLTTKDISKIQLDSDRIIHLSLSTPLNEDLNFIHFTISHHVLHGEDDWVWESCIFADFEGELPEDFNCSQYRYQSNGKPVLEVQLNNHFSQEIFENPYITITQEFVDKLAENDFTLEDIAFMFVTGTKTETITVVEEGYTKVNGAIVLDIDNIQNNMIFNDTYYNASLIIDNVKRGVPVLFKDGMSFSTLASANLADGNSFITSSNGTTINLIPENVFSPATITGAELKEQMRIIKGEWGLDFRGDNLMYFIEDSGQVSHEEALKLMAPGTIISLFDGLITLDYILSTGEEADHIDYELYLASPTQPMGEQFGYFKGDPCLGNVYCSWSSASVGFDWSNIEDSKEYSTDIIIKFADNTTKAIKTTVRYISAIFVQNIPN